MCDVDTFSPGETLFNSLCLSPVGGVNIVASGATTDFFR